MILTLDIGNTNIKCALFEDDRLKKAWRMSTDRHKTHDEYGVLLSMFLKNAGYDKSEIEGVIMSSVVPTINYTIEHMIDDYFGVEPIQVVPGIKTGINIHYDNPQALGADRICNAVAAQKEYGGPCIYIDFGTATTFGVLSKKGEFLGGAICPGLKLASEALTERAAQLSKVELVKPETVIGRNTITNSGRYRLRLCRPGGLHRSQDEGGDRRIGAHPRHCDRRPFPHDRIGNLDH